MARGSSPRGATRKRRRWQEAIGLPTTHLLTVDGTGKVRHPTKKRKFGKKLRDFITRLKVEVTRPKKQRPKGYAMIDRMTNWQRNQMQKEARRRGAKRKTNFRLQEFKEEELQAFLDMPHWKQGRKANHV